VSRVPIMTAGTVVVERGPFEMVPHWLLEESQISAQALRLWLVLRKHGDETKTSFPGRKRLGDMLGVSRSTVTRAAQELVDMGAMCYRQRSSDDGDWSSNEYHLHWVSVRHCTFFSGLGSPQAAYPRPQVDDGSPQVSHKLILNNSDLPNQDLKSEKQGATSAPSDDNRLAQEITKTYTDRVPLSKFVAVLGIVKRALKADYTADQITDALAALADEGRPVTVDTLRIQMEGGLPAAKSKSQARMERNVAAMANWEPIQQHEWWELTPAAQGIKEVGR
jgi:DNA-binding transcriptional MocR family regulator